eukprot:CAMPEP_0206503976 /NCGR_PEP_ID=MMETSP0324_2-20121206/55134_1 /ASSEMBLY_ACC=CAM_ASM_000836 /TAXON_ID=2866 /ORGANISM="Crypthecodinium cohnii, Strain Seligo" /LENGTH=588 /DNA_ID=CAMNT_0053992905 /DNA_START=16 /DNA_END=1778 /DNA_ORIENTATION=+
MDGPILSQLRRLFLTFWRYFGNSDYLAGMLAMSAMGIARDAVEKLCRQLFVFVVRFLWVSVRLEEKDAELVLAWLRERPEVHSSTQLTLFSRSTAQNAGRIFEYEPEIQTTTRLRCSVGSAPKQWMWITRREAKEPGGRRLKAVTVSFFTRNKYMLEAIIEKKGREIQRRQMEKYLTVVQVYDFGKEHGLNWLHPQEKDRKQPGRSISSVVLPRCPLTGLDQAEALLDDAREFLDSELWYTERGIPYRRGYLLHGVPGGGKSSLVMAIASELMLPIYMLQLSSEQMSDDTLNSLLQYGMHDPPTILLLEDVDLLHTAVLHRRGPEVEDLNDNDAEESDVEIGKPKSRAKGTARVGTRNRRLTLSGLLNALDGPTATTGRLLFMTTNARDRLDPALLRSGRIDYELEFTHAVPEQIGRLFERFYQDFRSNPGRAKSKNSPINSSEDQVAATKSETTLSKKVSNTKQLAAEFAQKVRESDVKLTSADVQRHLMKRKTDPERALRELPALLEMLSKSQKASSSLAAPAQRAQVGGTSSASKKQRNQQQQAAPPHPPAPDNTLPVVAVEVEDQGVVQAADTSALSCSPRGSA